MRIAEQQHEACRLLRAPVPIGVGCSMMIRSLMDE
jgi:hypothetical protein